MTGGQPCIPQLGAWLTLQSGKRAKESSRSYSPSEEDLGGLTLERCNLGYIPLFI